MSLEDIQNSLEGALREINTLEKENQGLRVRNTELEEYIKIKCKTCKALRSIEHKKRKLFLKELDKARNLGVTHREYKRILDLKCQYQEDKKDGEKCGFYTVDIYPRVCFICKKNNDHFPPIKDKEIE